MFGLTIYFVALMAGAFYLGFIIGVRYAHTKNSS